MPFARSQAKSLAVSVHPQHIGKLVIIRDVTRQYLQRIIWDFDESAVYVLSTKGYEMMVAGQTAIPIGFPRRDVFQYDQAALENADWSRLREWSP